MTVELRVRERYPPDRPAKYIGRRRFPITPEVEPGSGNSAELERRIRQRAYELYVARGCHDGHADEDWRLAEEEILGITGGG